MYTIYITHINTDLIVILILKQVKMLTTGFKIKILKNLNRAHVINLTINPLTLIQKN